MPCRLINRGDDNVNPIRYLERYYVGTLFGFTFYLHRFVASDGDEWVHDHPWNSIAIILIGGYQEERMLYLDQQCGGWKAKFKHLKPFMINIIRGKDFHRIVESKPETWTLFIHGKRFKSWAFLQDTSDMVVYHQPYTFDVDKPCRWYQENPVLGKNSDRAPFPYDG